MSTTLIGDAYIARTRIYTAVVSMPYTCEEICIGGCTRTDQPSISYYPVALRRITCARVRNDRSDRRGLNVDQRHSLCPDSTNVMRNRSGAFLATDNRARRSSCCVGSQP